MILGRFFSRGLVSLKSFGVRKRSVSVIIFFDREFRLILFKRIIFFSEFFFFFDLSDIIKRDSFRYYRGFDNLRSSFDSDSTSVISFSDELLTDSFFGSLSFNSRLGIKIFFLWRLR